MNLEVVPRQASNLAGSWTVQRLEIVMGTTACLSETQLRRHRLRMLLQ
jgi:hypothetical protein